MQRVAVDLHSALSKHPAVLLSTRALRSSWRWIGPNTVGFLGGLLATLPKQARTDQADVVLFSSMVTAALAPALRKRVPHIAFAAITHGQDVVLPMVPYQKWLPTVFRSLDAVLPVSRATGAACVERGADRESIYVQPNGIQPDRFPSPSEDERDWLCHKLEVPDDAFFLISVGRQVRRKGSAWFVEQVLPLLPESVHYVIVGSGPEDGTIIQAAQHVGLAHRVHPLGRVSEEDLPRALRSADLFVMPNVPVPGDMEGFGVVMLEAALCGLPTVAARLEGVADVISDGQNGYLVEPLDAQGFATRIQDYVANRGLLSSRSARASAFTRDRFAWPAVADQLVQTLQRVVESKR